MITLLTRRWPTVLGIAAAALLLGLGLLEPFADGIVVAALVYLVWGALRGHLRRPGLLVLQIAGVLLFGAVGLVAVSTDVRFAQVLLAAGWLGHTAWDVAHYRANVVVPRWWAEQCAVVDAVVAVAILVAALR